MPRSRVLIFSATKLYRHESIQTATEALKSHGDSIDVHFDASEDDAVFSDGGLAQYDAVLFLSTSGDVISESGLAALQRFFDRGGHFVGVHCAAWTHTGCDFYVRQLGASFDYHPEFCHAVVEVLDPNHPSTKMLPERWPVEDEMYNFTSDPRKIGATVLLSVDESSYTDPGPRKYDHGTPHPIAWYQERAAGVSSGGTPGRSFFTSLGHSHEIWKDKLFMAHVMGGIRWTLNGKAT